MISRRFMEKFNRITYAAVMATVIILAVVLVEFICNVSVFYN